MSKKSKLVTNHCIINLRKKRDEFFEPIDYLSDQYGIKTEFKIREKKYCNLCMLCIQDMKINDKLVLFRQKDSIILYFCETCFIGVKIKLTETNQKEQFLNQNIPFRINDLHKSIKSHKDYDNLDSSTKMQFEYCMIKKNRDNNKWSRDLWYHLYHDLPKPI